MKKIVNPCKCCIPTRNGLERMYNAFVKIEYVDGKLSLVGVVAPTKSGNCLGSAGQCTEDIRNGEPTEKWTREMLDKMCDIWDKWHLNDMRPYCSHQKELGWDKQAEEKVKIEKWTLTEESIQKKKNAEKRALQCLKDGKPFYPTKDEITYARMEYEMEVYNDEDKSYDYGKLYRDAYELKDKDCLGRSTTEYKTRGWISYKDHDLGLIGKPCPVCGYGYGTNWVKEEVPKEVIDFLFSLPETKIRPAWI